MSGFKNGAKVGQKIFKLYWLMSVFTIQSNTQFEYL